MLGSWHSCWGERRLVTVALHAAGKGHTLLVITFFICLITVLFNGGAAAFLMVALKLRGVDEDERFIDYLSLIPALKVLLLLWRCCLHRTCITARDCYRCIISTFEIAGHSLNACQTLNTFIFIATPGGSERRWSMGTGCGMCTSNWRQTQQRGWSTASCRAPAPSCRAMAARQSTTCPAATPASPRCRVRHLLRALRGIMHGALHHCGVVTEMKVQHHAAQTLTVEDHHHQALSPHS